MCARINVEPLTAGRTNQPSRKRPGSAPQRGESEANALYVGEPDRLLREVAPAGVLEAADALRSGRGLIEDTARNVVREIGNGYPDAGLSTGIGQTLTKTIDAQPCSSRLSRPT